MKKNLGFTLIEVIIYVAIVAIITTAFVTFSLNSSDIRARVVLEQEVNSNGRIALDIIRRYFLDAHSILDAPNSTFGTDPGALVLCMVENVGLCSSVGNQVKINLNQDDGSVQVTEGSNSSVLITSEQVYVTRFVFQNIDDSSILIRMVIQSNPPGDETALSFSQYFQSSLTMR